MALKNNTWKLNQWYDQSVAGNASYSGKKNIWFWGYHEQPLFADNDQGSASIAYSSPIQLGTAGPNNQYADSDIWSNPISGSSAPGGTSFVFATRTDGTLWGWGRNNLRVIKPPTSDTQYSPYQIPGTTWSKVAFGQANVGATKTDGTLWMWGENDKGNLGQNEGGPGGATRSSPTQVPGTTWDGIHIYSKSFLATKTDGTLWTWGDAGNGRLGLNDNVQRSSPTQIPGEWGNQIAGGGSRAGAIRADGSLYVWGYNANGDLGVNNRTAYSSPIQVGSESTWNSLSVGGEKMIATKTNGELWVWGNNYYGSLGQNVSTSPSNNYSSPVQIPGTTWSSVGSVSYQAACALKTDGTIWAWGLNNSGNLGQNSLVNYSSPVQVPGTDYLDVKMIGDGKAMMALRSV